MIEPTIISHCERPGCGLPIQGLVAIIDGKSVCHRHTLELVEKPPPTNVSTILEHTFPASIIEAMAKGDVLQIVVFSFIFGAACAAIGPKAQGVVHFCESLSEVMFKYTNYIMLEN